MPFGRKTNTTHNSNSVDRGNVIGNRLYYSMYSPTRLFSAVLQIEGREKQATRPLLTAVKLFDVYAITSVFAAAEGRKSQKAVKKGGGSGQKGPAPADRAVIGKPRA
jgi:hypothetical protein